MPGRCQVCSHKDRKTIDEDLVQGGDSLSVLAQRYGVSRDSLWRHKTSHLAPALVEAHRLSELERGRDLLGQMAHLTSRTLRVLEAAEKAKDLRASLAAIEACRRNMMVTAGLLSEAHRQSAGTGVSGPPEPIDFSMLTDAEFYVFGHLLCKVQGHTLPEPQSEAQRRALAAFCPRTRTRPGPEADRQVTTLISPIGAPRLG